MPKRPLEVHPALLQKRIQKLPACLPATCKLRNRYLDCLNGHPRDRRVFFDAGVAGEVHDYWVDWKNDGTFCKNATKSVTSLVKVCFPEFDPPTIIAKMKCGKNWHKSKYFGQTDEEIAAGWRANGKEAREKGIAVHDSIDCIYNGERPEKIREEEIELCQFQLFREQVEKQEKLTPFRSEWFVYTNWKTCITGAVDMTFVNNLIMDILWRRTQLGAPPPKVLHIVIVDWKRSKGIKKYNAWEKGFPPLEKMPNSNFYHYSMQLSLYKWILETFYHNITWNGHTYDDIVIDAMYLLVLHPKQKKRFIRHRCPDYTKEVQKLVGLRQTSLERQRAGLPEIYPFDKSQPPPAPEEEVNFDDL